MLKFAIMSSNCPDWTFEQMVDGAVRYGYQGVDVRVEWNHRHGLELDATAEARAHARRYAADHGIAVSCVALSTRLARATQAERDEAVEQVRRYAQLAADLGCSLLRVFGGRLPEGHTMEALRPHTAETLARAAMAATPFGVTPCLEVHDQHNNPADVAWIVERAAHLMPGLQTGRGSAGGIGVLWHVYHHVRIGISVDDAYRQLKGWVRHLHSGRGGAVPMTEDDHYLARAFELLQRDGFDGYAGNEWIIKRNDEMDPDEHLPRAIEMLHRWRGAA